MAETGLTVGEKDLRAALVTAGTLGLGVLLVLDRLKRLEKNMASMEERLGGTLSDIRAEIADVGGDVGRVEGLVQELRDAVAAQPDLTDELALAEEALSGLRGLRGRLEAVAPEVAPPPVVPTPEA